MDDEAGAMPSRFEAGVDVVLADALRITDEQPESEARVCTAFRTARDEGTWAARTRRQDDWRPRGSRYRPAWSVRAGFGAVVAALTLGGVAVAGIGAVSDRPAAPPAASGSPTGAANTPAAGVSGTPTTPVAKTGDTIAPSPTSGATTSSVSEQARDHAAKCRAYESVVGHGKALEATAWQRLVEAAGGAERVAAYCATESATAKHGAPSAHGKGNSKEPGHGNATSHLKVEPRSSADPAAGKAAGKAAAKRPHR